MTIKRIVEVVLEIAVGLCVVVGCYYWATQRSHEEFPAKWLGFIISTAILFGYPVYWTRARRDLRKFWSRWTGLLIAHICLIASLLLVVQQWPLVLFVATTLGEFILIAPVLNVTKPSD
jgi:hypothetical protein